MGVKYLLFILIFISIQVDVFSQNLRKGNNLYSPSAGERVASPLTITSIDSSQLVSTITNTLFGGGVSISNVTYKGAIAAIANFEDSTNSFGIKKGLILTTGIAALAKGPNNMPDAGSNNNITVSDPDIALIDASTQYDLAVIEFDFSTSQDSVCFFKFVFGSEEYPEFANSVTNDLFAFFISGPGITGNKNIAFIPGTAVPVSINNVNKNTSSSYFVTNPASSITLQ
ncbi:MAG: choice-of-anchor L domain-containing protein, partial [Bacteroidetes bacterium]|nr:choice-of-anchor L domain-containing protein [Bacteroidota bacterium]